MGNELVESNRLDPDKAFLESKASSQIQSLSKNYSSVSDRELRVVKSYFDWLTFTRKKKEASSKNMFAEKALDVLVHFAEGGKKNAVSKIYSAGKTFVTVVYYSTMFPKIKKKYGLYNVNKKK